MWTRGGQIREQTAPSTGEECAVDIDPRPADITHGGGSVSCVAAAIFMFLHQNTTIFHHYCYL